MSTDEEKHGALRTDMPRRRVLLRRWYRWYSRKLTPLASAIYFKTSLHKEQHTSSFANGLREAVWTFLCGNDITYSLHIGNIWWCKRWLP